MRSGGLTTAGLAAGTLVGSALQSWLRVDIVPIGVSTHIPSNDAGRVCQCEAFMDTPMAELFDPILWSPQGELE